MDGFVFQSASSGLALSNAEASFGVSGQRPDSLEHFIATSSLWSILELLPQPLLMLRRDRRLVFSNENARRLFIDGRANQRNDHLMALGQFVASQLEILLGHAARGISTNCCLWFERDMTTGWLQASRVSHTVARQAGLPEGEVVLLTVHLDQPALTQAARVDALTRQCRLSPTERHVLMLLADGVTVEMATQHLGLKLSTLRSHVRNLLTKTQAPSLMQLLRWVGSAQALPH